MDVKAYLIEKSFEFKEIQRPNGINAVMLCPFCSGGPKHEKDTFAINLETGAWNCLRRNHCGEAGSFWQFQQKLGDTPKREPFCRNKVSKSRSYVLPKVDTKELSKQNRQYLQSRGLNPATVAQFGLFNGSKGEICFPYFKGGKQVNIKHRTNDKKFWQEKDAETCLFNHDATQDGPLIIAEGEIDCITLSQYGFKNVTSLPSGVNDYRWIENEWEFLEKFKIIYLCMDADTAGQQAVDVLVNRLGRWRCSSVVFPLKDANECLQKGLTKGNLDACFQKAKEFPPTKLKSSGYFYQEVAELFANPDQFKGTDTAFPGLDYYLRGWRKGETTVWSGQNSSGKSTILNQVCLSLASQKIRTCIASLELRPARYLKWMVSQVIGKDSPNPDEVCKVFSWIDEWVFILNTAQETSPVEIFEVFEYAARRYGVEHFVIDSLMRISLPGQDKYDAQKKFVSQVTDFAKKYQCHCHLVAHPRKSATDDTKTDKVDVAGSGDITNLADNVLTLWRAKEETKAIGDPDTILYVKKNREYGDCGGVRLFFDPKSKLFRCQDQKVNFYFNASAPF